jgi:XTP/dITP diphosphohydrolase
MVLVFCTNNAHKVSEVEAILAGTGISIRTLAEFPDIPEPPETSGTFDGNALQKARFVYEKTGLACIADDSGIEVDALNGAPGVHSKRFSPEATSESNNILLLDKLAGRDDRGSRFRCVLAFVCDEGEGTVEGRCEGTIGSSVKGVGGFGYDPLFWPLEQPGKTMAELTMAEKNAISHRGRAFRQLPDLLAKVRS